MAKRKSLPSQQLDISPEKARKILKDGTVRGHELTSAQRAMFGAKAGEARRKRKGSK